MSTTEPGAFTERGDEAEAAALRGDGAYSGGDFAGADPERYEHLSGDVGRVTAMHDEDSTTVGTATDVESRDPQHPRSEQGADGPVDQPGRS